MNAAAVHALLIALGCTNAQTRGNGWIESTCPFAPWEHSKGTDRSPSFGVSTHEGDMSFYRCHSCNKKGPLKYLPKALSKYRDVVAISAQIAAGDHVDPNRIAAGFAKKAKEAQEDYYIEAGGIMIRRSLLPSDYVVGPPLDEAVLAPFRSPPEEVVDWLLGPKRNLTLDIIRRWDIGYNGAKGRVSIPIRDLDGRLVGYSGRAFFEGQKPKFLHSKGFQRDLFLFGEHTAVKGGTGYLVEGFFDVIRLQEWGYSAVAVLGTSISNVHLEKLARFYNEVVILFDGDSAGRTGAAPVAERIATRLPMRTVQLPEGVDPDELHDPEERVRLLGPALNIAASELT